MDWAHSSGDHNRTAVCGSMVDHGWRRGWSSPEDGHAGVPMRGNSPWWFREQEEETGILTEVFDGWCGDGGSGTRRHEGVEQRAAQGVVTSDSVRGAFILGRGKGAEAVAVGARPAAIDRAVSGGVEGRGRRAGGGR
jgi:hypothetical protein